MDTIVRQTYYCNGDDGSARSAVAIQYKGRRETFIVGRTGYYEKDLVNPAVRNIKLDGSLHVKIKQRTELSYGYRFGLMDGVFQRGNKIQLDGVTVQNHKIELRGSDFLARAYMLIENTGSSYNLNPLAYNLDLNNGSNSVWAGRFQTELQTQVNAGVDLASAMNLARITADKGRVEPGTPAFNTLKNNIVGINNWDIAVNVPSAPATGGAALWQRSHTYHGDLQWSLRRIAFADVLVGGDFRRYEVVPDGNNFVDFSRPAEQRTTPGGRNQVYQEYGAFISATRTLWQDRLKLSASLRIDHNPEFSPKLNPRLALVYTAAQQHNFRATYQSGYRFPSLFEALSYVNNAGVRRVGGLARVNAGLGYLENSYTLASLNAFMSAVNTDVANGLPQTGAALKNRGQLVVANLPAEQPEHINSFELGYKSVLANNKFVIDVDAYYSVYRNFLGQVEVAVPTTGPVCTDAAVLDMLSRGKQIRYRVYTNARDTYHSYGTALALTWNFYRKYVLTGNMSYNALVSNDNPDVFVTGFNTPKYVTNIGFGNREVIRHVGFNVVWRWQDRFMWQSPLANGLVPAYQTIDAQLTYRLSKPTLTFKAGASNVFNNRYIQYAAGPTIGGLYYLAITYDVIRL